MHVVAVLTNAGVRFIVVGGRAVQFHGHNRSAKDLDLLVEFSADNWEKLETGLRLLEIIVPKHNTLIDLRPLHRPLPFYPSVELLTGVYGVTFGEAWANSIETTFGGLRLRVLSKADLIRSKSARPEDAEDIRALKLL